MREQLTNGRLALESLDSAFDVVAMCLSDQPQIGEHELIALLNQFIDREPNQEVVMPMVAGQRGNPVLFSKKAVEEILQIPGMVCRTFMDKYPEMEVEVIVTDKELDLSTREADVAIWMRQPTQLSYIQKKLIDINYHIYGSPKYLEENGYPNTIKDLDKHKFIVYGKGTPSPLSQTDWILKVGKKDSSKRKSVMRVNNIYSLLLAVDSGVGLAALPDYMVQEKSSLVKVLSNVDGPKYEAHFVYPQSLKNVARVKSFRDFIFDKVNEWRF